MHTCSCICFYVLSDFDPNAKLSQNSLENGFEKLQTKKKRIKKPSPSPPLISARSLSPASARSRPSSGPVHRQQPQLASPSLFRCQAGPKAFLTDRWSPLVIESYSVISLLHLFPPLRRSHDPDAHHERVTVTQPRCGPSPPCSHHLADRAAPRTGPPLHPHPLVLGRDPLSASAAIYVADQAPPLVPPTPLLTSVARGLADSLHLHLTAPRALSRPTAPPVAAPPQTNLPPSTSRLQPPPSSRFAPTALQ